MRKLSAIRWYWSALLFVVALVIVPALSVLGLIWAVFNRGFWLYLYRCAVSLDQTGNTFCGNLFNSTLQRGGYSFGNPDETVSSAIGKNEELGTLTTVGTGVNWFLNKLDPGHSRDSIEENP